MSRPPLRCHLLIGPPGSGKTTLARDLAPLIAGPQGQPAVVLSTDALRAELFGDAAVQGPWPEIQQALVARLQQAVAGATPVIIDGTHARRPWRLLYTQALTLPEPVEWIGWWLTTPLPTCLEWAAKRERPVPEAVIHNHHAVIGHRQFGPSRAEGFAALLSLNPGAGEGQPAQLQQRLRQLDRHIRNALNRDSAKQSHLHRYSRLLDLERLLFLLRLLTTLNGLDASDPATASALAQICTPSPEGDLAERAAAYLSRWSDVHGGYSEVFGDAVALRGDLAWLEANGFTRLDWESDRPIDPGPWVAPTAGGVHGGFPTLADAEVFRRVFTLLRHILKEPFDGPLVAAAGEHGAPLYRYLMERLAPIEGSYLPTQEAVLRNDLRHLLRPYGFSPKISGRPDSLRQGYAIGTALLSADQLLEVHSLLKASMERLSDASHKPLLQALEERLRRAGLLDAAHRRRLRGRRALAHRSFTEERSGTLADQDQSERIERAIQERRRVWLRHLIDPVPPPQNAKGDDGRFRAWPLQLLFHYISWYLVFEVDAIGTSEGLIRALRVDRLVLHGPDGAVRRSQEQEHERAMARLERLLHLSGGLYFGTSLDGQLAVMPARSEPPGATGGAIPGREWLETLRFSCTPEVFALIREEPNRFPPEHTTYAAPNPPGDSHPYPVEVLLPRWTVRESWELRSWLFRWGAGVRIEQPLELRERHLQQALSVVALYDGTAHAPSADAEPQVP